MANPDSVRVCAYCGWTYAETPRHRAEKLTRYCSHGCRLAVELPSSHGGVSLVDLGAADWGKILDGRSDMETTAEENVEALDDQAHKRLRAAMHALWRLSWHDYVIVVGRILECSYDRIARRLGVSVQAIEQRHRNLMLGLPVLAVMFPAKASAKAPRPQPVVVRVRNNGREKRKRGVS
jgi:hypothetical protein